MLINIDTHTIRCYNYVTNLINNYVPVHLVRQINCGYFPIMMVKELQLLYHNRKRDFSTYTYFGKVGVVTTTYFGKVGAIIICFCHSFNIYLPTKITYFVQWDKNILLLYTSKLKMLLFSINI